MGTVMRLTPRILFSRCLTVLVAWMCAQSALWAATLVSNLGEADSGDSVDFGADYIVASAFKTPASGVYTLTGVVLPLKVLNNGSPLVARIYSVAGSPDASTGANNPGTGTLQATLSSPAFTIDPANYVNYLFTSAGLSLQPDSWYWVTVETAGSADYDWSYTLSSASSGVSGTSVFNGFSDSYNGGAWSVYGPANNGSPQRFEIQASAPSGLTYATWSGGLPTTEDANKDGISNLMAYALGAANPTENARSRLAAFTKVTGGYQYAIASTIRTDVLYEIQMSTTLAGSSWATGVLARKTAGGSWTAGDITSGITVTPTTDGVSVTDTNGGTRRFWQLSVSLP